MQRKYIFGFEAKYNSTSVLVRAVEILTGKLEHKLSLIKTNIDNMNITEILSSGPAVSAALTAALAALYKGVRAILEFNDNYIKKRRFNYLSYLKIESDEHDDLTNFIASVKRERLFAAAFGRPVSPRMAIALMLVYESKFFSIAELRSSSAYMKFADGGLIKIETGKTGVFIALLIGVILMSMILFLFALILKLVVLATPASLATAALMAIFFVAFGLFIAKDALEVFIARRVGCRLDLLNEGNIVFSSSKISSAATEIKL